MRGRIIKAHVPSWLADHPCFKGGTLEFTIQHCPVTQAQREVEVSLHLMLLLDDPTAGELEVWKLLQRWVLEGIIAEDAFKEHGHETRKEIQDAKSHES